MRILIAIISLITFISCQKEDRHVKGFYEDGPRRDTANKPIYTIYYPSSFTPNGDALNDHFGVEGYGIDINFRLEIYSQDNDLIFFSNDPMKQWDGRMNYAGVVGPAGQYPVKISFTDIDGVDRAGTATVSLVR